MEPDDNSHFDAAHAAMLELEERTTIALQHAVDAKVPEDDIRLLCFHSGIPFTRLEQRK